MNKYSIARRYRLLNSDIIITIVNVHQDDHYIYDYVFQVTGPNVLLHYIKIPEPTLDWLNEMNLVILEPSY